MTENWYALHTKPYKESLVVAHLASETIVHYYPTIPHPRHKQKTMPFFPGYLFVKADLTVTGRNAFNYRRGCRGRVQLYFQKTFRCNPHASNRILALALPQSADVNEQLHNACAEYHRRFGQRPCVVIIPRNVPIHPIAGISVQVNAFIPETAFYFRKPGVSG